MIFRHRCAILSCQWRQASSPKRRSARFEWPACAPACAIAARLQPLLVPGQALRMGWGLPIKWRGSAISAVHRPANRRRCCASGSPVARHVRRTDVITKAHTLGVRTQSRKCQKRHMSGKNSFLPLLLDAGDRQRGINSSATQTAQSGASVGVLKKAWATP